MDKARGQFGIPEGKESPPMEAVIKTLTKTMTEGTRVCARACVCNSDLFHFKSTFSKPPSFLCLEHQNECTGIT